MRTYANRIEVRCGSTVTKLVHHVETNGSKTVPSVEVNGKETIEADAIILATGGFG